MLNGFAVIYIVLVAINLLCSAFLHGKSKTGKYNFWESLFGTALGLLLLLGAIGFFN